MGTSDNSQSNEQQLLAELKAAKNELNLLKVKLKSALNGTRDQVTNVTRRKREEPSPPGPSPPPGPPAASSPAPPVQSPTALPGQADPLDQQTPSALPSPITNASSTSSQSDTSSNISEQLSNPVDQTNPSLTTSNFSSINNSAAAFSSPSSIQSLSRNVHEILDQLSAAGGQVTSPSAEVGNITELIARLKINGNFFENNTMENTEDSINLLRNLLNSLDEAEKKLDEAIERLEEEQAKAEKTTSGAGEARQGPRSEAERTKLSAINGTLIRLEEILQNLITKAADSSNSSSSGVKCCN